MRTAVCRYGVHAAVTAALAVLATEVRGDVAYSVLRNGRWRIYVQTALNASPALIDDEITADAGEVALRTDRKKVAFETTDGQIRVCDLVGKRKCEVAAKADAQLARPAWFPHSDDLAMVKFQVGPIGEDSDLIHYGGGVVLPLLMQTGVQDDPAVDPSGTVLAYTSTQTVSLRGSGFQVVQQLWLVDLKTGHARPIILSDGRDIQPDWSPSGTQLAFSSNRGGEFDIWVVDADGQNLRMVTAGKGTKTAPAWSPDGNAIMFTMVQDDRYGLWIIDLDGRNLRQFQPFGRDAAIEVRDADWQ